jgi:RNA polymerase sigma-70 factor (ECF subfamily)
MARSPDAPKLRLVGGKALARRVRAPLQFQELTDAQLVGLVSDGDAEAFEVLYLRHSAFAMGLAVRIQGTSVDVEDIVHDAFVRVHGQLGELREASAFRAWLGSIVVSLVRTRLRRRRLLGALGLTSPEPVDLDSIASTDADPSARVLLAQIYALLQTLAPADRIAWTLRYIERHRLEMVAELMGCSLATAKRRILRAQRFIAGHFVAPFAKDDP